ncbi:uncharacterized protein BJ171DRAFT_640854 [Polychytrium aggregatum]|uniref:uncharacterized protein n=1 Tax=Polychytrium aggregatum TaxID=110093 RepID=UPI0022FEDA6A|nr:uncharacterized protein BJ171DRAFT_640854 [Polychytrium aggregatum]KAI9193193.1 hypothetical protein BJ171DRAFT_640854 [Polychytrium aggregatum]
MRTSLIYIRRLRGPSKWPQLLDYMSTLGYRDSESHSAPPALATTTEHQPDLRMALVLAVLAAYCWTTQSDSPVHSLRWLQSCYDLGSHAQSPAENQRQHHQHHLLDNLFSASLLDDLGRFLHLLGSDLIISQQDDEIMASAYFRAQMKMNEFRAGEQDGGSDLDDCDGGCPLPRSRLVSWSDHHSIHSDSSSDLLNELLGECTERRSIDASAGNQSESRSSQAQAMAFVSGAAVPPTLNQWHHAVSLSDLPSVGSVEWHEDDHRWDRMMALCGPPEITDRYDLSMLDEVPSPHSDDIPLAVLFKRSAAEPGASTNPRDSGSFGEWTAKLSQTLEGLASAWVSNHGH